MDILEETKSIMNKYNLQFKKKFGQNFLISEDVLDGIVQMADVSKGDIVIEIGPGVGTLTKKLLEKAAYVVSIEKDSDLKAPLEGELSGYDNFFLLIADILDVSILDILNMLLEKGIKYSDYNIKIVANIPYYITTDIISKLANEAKYFDSACLMVQKEFAERMRADVGTREASALTYFVKYNFEVISYMEVSSENFIPRPKVSSEVIVLKTRNEKYPKIYDSDLEEMYFELIKIGFMYRRKTFLNSIRAHGKYDRDKMKTVLEDLGIDERIRGEMLKDTDYLNICKKYMEYGG